MMIQTIDAILVVIIGFMAFLGGRSGLIHESVTLLGFVLGIFAGNHYGTVIGGYLTHWLQPRSVANLGGFVIAFVVAWVFAIIVGAILRSILHDMGLGWADRLGGLALGVVKGLILSEIIVLVLMAAPGRAMHEAIYNSLLASRLAYLAPDLLDLIPPMLRYWKPF
jgi:membrane protein required for colicin V production